MKDSLRNNKMLLRRKRRFKKEKTFLNKNKSDYKEKKDKLFTKRAKPELLREIKRKGTQRKRLKVLLYVCFSLILVFITTIMVFKLNKSDEITLEKLNRNKLSPNERKALMFLNKGDGWFKESKWDAAIFYYKKAKSLYPKNFEIEYRIINTMSFMCKYEYKDCRQTKFLLDSLFSKHPNRIKDLEKIKKNLSYEYN